MPLALPPPPFHHEGLAHQDMRQFIVGVAGHDLDFRLQQLGLAYFPHSHLWLSRPGSFPRNTARLKRELDRSHRLHLNYLIRWRPYFFRTPSERISLTRIPLAIVWSKF